MWRLLISVCPTPCPKLNKQRKQSETEEWFQELSRLLDPFKMIWEFSSVISMPIYIYIYIFFSFPGFNLLDERTMNLMNFSGVTASFWRPPVAPPTMLRRKWWRARRIALWWTSVGPEDEVEIFKNLFVPRINGCLVPFPFQVHGCSGRLIFSFSGSWMFNYQLWNGISLNESSTLKRSCSYVFFVSHFRSARGMKVWKVRGKCDQ